MNTVVIPGEARSQIFLMIFSIPASAGMTDQHPSGNSNLDKIESEFLLSFKEMRIVKNFYVFDIGLFIESWRRYGKEIIEMLRA